MKSSLPFSIGRDTFPQCWDYVDKCRRRAKRNAAIAKTGGFLVTLFFFLSLLFLGCGLLYTHVSGSFRAFWEAVPCFPMWQKAAAAVLKEGAGLPEEIGRVLVLSYLASAVVFALIAAVFHLIYHPRKFPVPTGSYAENAALLAKKAQDARDYSYQTRISASVIATVLSIIALVMVFFAYMIYTEDAAAIAKLLGSFPTSDISTNCLLFILLLYLLCGITSGILIFITRPLYRCHFPYDLLVQTQKEALMAQPDAQQLTDGISALREEALILERTGAYNMAMDMLHKAAVCGDVPAMEHYARHCLLKRMNDSARYWLKRSISSGSASRQTKAMLLRLTLRMHHNTEYLKPEEAPLTTGAKLKRALAATISIVWKLFLLSLFAALLLGMYLFFASYSHPEILDKLPEGAAQFFTGIQSMSQSSASEELPVEEVSPFQTPEMTLSIADTKWEHNPAVVTETGDPVIFCYSKTQGGDLRLPYHLNGEKTIGSAGLFTGNKWDVRKITKHITCLPQTNTLLVAESYLQSLEPGDYYIILNDDSYLPLIVSDITQYNSTQRGLAAAGNENSWIINDLTDPQDITLSFYNLGDNPIRSVFQIQRIAMIPNPIETAIDPQYFTISPDGSSVTLHADYLAQQPVGFCMGLKVRLANGDNLDTGYTYIGTAEDGFTGMLEIHGDDTYSLSKGKDYVAEFHFGLPGAPMSLSVSLDGQEPILQDDLTDLISDFADLETGIITIPEDLLKENLTKGDFFNIGISYSNSHSQMAYTNLRVEVKK